MSNFIQKHSKNSKGLLLYKDNAFMNSFISNFKQNTFLKIKMLLDSQLETINLTQKNIFLNKDTFLRKIDCKILLIINCVFQKYSLQMFTDNFQYKGMDKIIRNQSTQTVPKQGQAINFFIFYQQQQVLKTTLKTNQTMGDLLDNVRQKLKNRFENIIALASVQGFFTLDYALTQKHYKLANIRNNQCLQIILEEIVNDYSTPTLADFRFMSCLGSGVSCAVYLVRHCSSGKLYALKQIKKDYFNHFRVLEAVLRQKKIMSQLINDLQFVTRLQSSFQSYQHLNFLLEFYPGGELFYHLTNRKLKEAQAKICFAQILIAIQQLHKRKILYRDLKPENIMVDFDGHLYLGDFGLCRINLEREDVVHSHCGSPEYMASETKQAQGYGYAADFYTMGAILYEMVKGVPPYYQTNLPPQFVGQSQSFRDLVLRLIQNQPSQRLTCYDEIKKSKFLREVDWQKIMKKQYKMPCRLNIYERYIHEQFLKQPIINQDLRYQQRYDKLMGSFFCMNPHKDGISQYYPQIIGSLIKKKKSRLSKNNDEKSNRSKSKSQKNSIKSKDTKFKKEDNVFKRKNIKQANIYVSPPNYTTRQNPLDRHESANKSLSRNKLPTPVVGLVLNRSPLKFNKIKTVKSSGNLKAPEYMKELQTRGQSKRKKFV